ncbi:uncharacterized protein LOC126624273 isoform X2 [Malus sylvestris]|uniref:uncharacterized protein LOC126624273 isoform X2 n=1 Tax=Malus sylvestris TaxID=3752 RepID=UPI0021AC8947|nr:uncharacterized protein LOC126624273 isoform X2 [Malus sylvestris]
MASAKDDSLQAIGVKLNGNNYVYWAYVMKNFLIGKGLWGYVSGMVSIPNNPKDEKYVELFAAWEMNNSKIITWINNSVDLAIGMQLAKFSTSKEVWDHLAKLYTKANFAKRYQLEMEIRTIQQGDKSIQVFYNELTNLWDQLALTEPEELGIVKLYCKYREEQRLVQFLMPLRDEFETLRSSILHRTPLPSVDSVLNELQAEEVRVQSHRLSSSSSNTSAFAAARSRRVAMDECSYCKGKGHWKSQCPKLSQQHELPQKGGAAAVLHIGTDSKSKSRKDDWTW